MMVTGTDLTAYRIAYNQLSDDVDAAYQALEHDPGHVETIRGALRVIKDHGAEDFLGLFLLHRHFECKPDTLFIERRFAPRQDHAPGHAQVLVTRAESVAEIPRRIFPHRFAFELDGKVQA